MSASSHAKEIEATLPLPDATSATAAPGPGAEPGQVNGMTYTLDKGDTIVAVSGQWDEFARNNNGEKTLASHVVGRKLERFIVGDTTRMFVLTMIMSARHLQRPIYRPYRCDSPTHKRFMEMIIQPRAEGRLEVIHRELYCEPLLHRARLVAVSPGSGATYAKRCSLCNRVQVEGVWSELDDAIESRRLQVEASGLKVIYGVCPDCLTRRGVPL